MGITTARRADRVARPHTIPDEQALPANSASGPLLRDDHLEHLRGSGLSLETVQRAGLRSVSQEEARCFGYAAGLSGLLIPYLGTTVQVAGRSVPYTRLRVEPEQQRAPGQKYENPLGLRIEEGLHFYPYFPPGVEALRKDVRQTVTITEGEKKALKLTQDGFPAIGLPGVFMFVKPGSPRPPDRKPIHPALKRWRWRGRTVLVCFDSDRFTKESVALAHERLCRALTGEGALVRLVSVPSLEGLEKTGVDDFLVHRDVKAYQSLVDAAEAWQPYAWLIDLLPLGLPPASLSAALEPARQALRESTPEERLELVHRLCARFPALEELEARRILSAPDMVAPRNRLIINDKQPRDVIHEAWLALLSSPIGDRLFYNGQQRPRLLLAERCDGKPMLKTLDFFALQARLYRAADWFRRTSRSLVPCSPPTFLAQDMLALPHESLRYLRAVTKFPILRRDGGVVCSAGYDPDSRLLYEPAAGPPLDLASLPEQPSVEQQLGALRLLADELLGDFPFSGERDRTHAVAALVLTGVRHLVEGPTPLHVIEAPSEGTGKTLLAEIFWLVATGEPASPTPLPVQEDELRKKILSLLMEGPPLVLVDNIGRALDSSSLAAVLTTTVWQDRVLGQTSSAEVANEAIWLATANNPTFSRELARRCVRIRLDARTEKPWMRKAFRHPHLKRWALDHRGELVGATLTLARGWLQAGAPAGSTTLGSYIGWSEVVGGILEHAGVSGFLEGTEESDEVSSEEEGDWLRFIAGWNQRFGPAPVSGKELAGLARELELFELEAESKGDRGARSRFSRALGLRRDRVFGELQLKVSRDRHTKQNCYALVPCR